LKVAAAMAEAPDRSLPDRHESWGDIKAAYRFLNNLGAASRLRRSAATKP